MPLSNSNTLFTNLEEKRSIMDFGYSQNENSMEKSINEYNHDDFSSSASLKLKSNEVYSNNNKGDNYPYSMGEAGYTVWLYRNFLIEYA